MSVVFLGTPEFAVPSLKKLLGSPFEVSAVFTQPDRPSGRGQKPHASPIKVLALDAGIPVFQPEKIRSEELRPRFEALRPDFIVVVAFGQILPAWLLKTPRIAPVNVHGSLLPKYRGAAPVIWAILKGETTTGITTMLMDEQLDTGDILLRAECPISPSTTGGELAAQLSQFGAELLIPTLEGLMNGTVKPVPQDHNRASWAPRIKKEQAVISWSRTAGEIHNQVRAYNPWPLAFCAFRDQRLQFLRTWPEAALDSSQLPPGTYLGRSATGMRILCGQGTVLEVLDVKPANRKPISGAEFANGFRLASETPAFLPEADGAGNRL